MTVDWHTAPDNDDTPRLEYCNADPTDWHTVKAKNESPVSMTDLSFELEGTEYAFDFETEDETTRAALEPGDRHRLRRDGHAPDIDEDLEVLTRVTFTVDGEEREEVRSDWIPMGW